MENWSALLLVIAGGVLTIAGAPVTDWFKSKRERKAAQLADKQVAVLAFADATRRWRFQIYAHNRDTEEGKAERRQLQLTVQRTAFELRLLAPDLAAEIKSVTEALFDNPENVVKLRQDEWQDAMAAFESKASEQLKLK